MKDVNHPAVFPKQLARDQINTWSNEKDIIYDPFMGSGTTAVECMDLDRLYIGSEISEEYHKQINTRIENKLGLLHKFF